MSELSPGGVNPALDKRGYGFLYSESEEANLEELRSRNSADLRRNVFGLFQHLTGMQPGINWAVYELPPKRAPIDEVGHDRDREILLLVDTRDLTSLPNVRIITNERFSAVDGTEQFLTEDFTLDPDHDAQFFVDAVEVHEEGVSHTATSSLFSVRDEKLSVDDYKDFTHSVGILTTSPHYWPTEQVMYPFGKEDNVLDQLDALAKGSELFSEIAFAEPLYWNVQPDIG